MYFSRKQLGYTAAFFAIVMLLGLFMGLMAAIGAGGTRLLHATTATEIRKLPTAGTSYLQLAQPPTVSHLSQDQQD